MSTKTPRFRAPLSFIVAGLVVGLMLAPASGFAETTASAIQVSVDQAKLIKLPERIATLVVGNPLIADVTMQAGGVMVVSDYGHHPAEIRATRSRTS